MPDPFSKENIKKSIDRVPGMGTEKLRRLLETAREKNLDQLITACDAELVARHDLPWSDTEAEQHLIWEKKASGLGLEAAIRLAFYLDPVHDNEQRVIRIIAENPDINHQSTCDFYGNGHVSLILGHLVYNRLGFFRHLLDGAARQSDLLIARANGNMGITYRLKPEFETVLRERGVI